MNPIAEEILSHFSGTEDELMHYGMPRRSGRYPWGSGEDPHQHGSRDFLGRVEELRKQGFTYTDEKGKSYTGDTAIAKSMGLSTTQFRTEIGIAKDERKLLKYKTIKSLTEDGLSPTEIGRKLGMNESSVRSVLDNKNYESRTKQARETADFIKSQIEKNRMVDVSKGTDLELRISKEKLDQALYLLEREGYPIYKNKVEQATNRGNWTNQKIICQKGTPYKDIYKLDEIHALNEDNYISRDGGTSFEKKFTYPSSMDSKRLKIRYAEDGGIEKDGIVELRRGVEDLSLGESRYSQVRILVDGTHYIKGMAVYSDDMPKGVDVVFNTNKKKNVAKMDVLKKITDDPDNPFGSAIKDVEQGGQYWYTTKKGERKLGLINKRADEGDWSEWKDALPSQFLGKQSLYMVKRQLKMAKDDKLSEFKEVMELENPTVKKHFLEKFADSCDAAAVSLQAAALPGQKYRVIIPITSLKDTEVYAPMYQNGSKLALVRYPHGGTFEIPILTVNNKHAAARKLLGTDITDAVGINSKVAERLSGADFDGDTVMCIPTHDSGGKVKISSRPALKGLEGFDPKTEYGPDSYEGRKVKLMVKGNVQRQMGSISNLITDMTLAGANDDELAKAVKHSMVVIDAYKHKLDYRKSEIDNDIPALHKKYQGKEGGGAATILSRSKGEYSVIKKTGSPRINQKDKEWYDPTKPEGAKIYKVDKDAYYTVTKTNKKTGETTTITKPRLTKSTKMAETDDAFSLVSDNRWPKEIAYAEYANSMKALANQARMEITMTGKLNYSKAAKAVYEQEVKDLTEKLRVAQLNAPRERAANRMANAEVAKKKAANPDMETKEIKKASQQALTKYRQEVGSISRKNRSINITDREWEAIQAGAISENILKQILANTDVDKLRERATPRTSKSLSTAQISRCKSLAASGYSIEEIARKMGKSPSTISNYLKGV